MAQSIPLQDPTTTHRRLIAKPITADGETLLFEMIAVGDGLSERVARVIITDPADTDTGLVVRVLPGTAAQSLGKAEDAAHASADVGVMALVVRQDSRASLAGATGDYVPLTVDHLNQLRISGAQAEDLPHTSGDTGLLVLAVRQDTAAALAGTDGDYIPLIADASGRVWVNVGAGTINVDNTALAVVGKGAAATALRVALADETTGVFAVGNVAHDAVDAGGPVKTGGKAVAHGSNPTAVAAADRTDWLFNRAGIPFVIGGHPNLLTRSYRWSAAFSNSALWAVSAGTIIVLTSYDIGLDEATTVGVGIKLGFGASAVPVTDGVIYQHAGLVPGGGVTKGDGAGILGIGGDGCDIFVTNDVATSGDLVVVLKGYEIPS